MVTFQRASITYIKLTQIYTYTMNNSAFEIYENWFKVNGLIYNIDNDDDLHFKYKTCNFFILNPKEDAQFLHIILPNIWAINSPEEYADALEVANELNAGRKALKVFLTRTNTFLSIEMFIDKTPDVEDFMERLLDILIEGRQMFVQEMYSRQS